VPTGTGVGAAWALVQRPCAQNRRLIRSGPPTQERAFTRPPALPVHRPGPPTRRSTDPPVHPPAGPPTRRSTHPPVHRAAGPAGHLGRSRQAKKRRSPKAIVDGHMTFHVPASSTMFDRQRVGQGVDDHKAPPRLSGVAAGPKIGRATAGRVIDRDDLDRDPVGVVQVDAKLDFCTTIVDDAVRDEFGYDE
jgi:hypothetical protein